MRYAKKRAQTPAYTIGIAHLDRQASQCNKELEDTELYMEHVSFK